MQNGSLITISIPLPTANLLNEVQGGFALPIVLEYIPQGCTVQVVCLNNT